MGGRGIRRGTSGDGCCRRIVPSSTGDDDRKRKCLTLPRPAIDGHVRHCCAPLTCRGRARFLQELRVGDDDDVREASSSWDDRDDAPLVAIRALPPKANVLSLPQQARQGFGGEVRLRRLCLRYPLTFFCMSRVPHDVTPCPSCVGRSATRTTRDAGLDPLGELARPKGQQERGRGH